MPIRPSLNAGELKGPDYRIQDPLLVKKLASFWWKRVSLNRKGAMTARERDRRNGARRAYGTVVFVTKLGIMQKPV
jgi:hypothetical protein